MTREQAKSLLPIIKAYSEGYEIQVKSSCGDWETFDDLEFCNRPLNYRIKPTEDALTIDELKAAYRHLDESQGPIV